MTKDLTFQEAMEQLEKIVQKLEKEEVQLEEAIDLYKKGMELSQYCQNKLQNAEKQLISIVNEDGKTEPFQITNGEG